MAHGEDVKRKIRSAYIFDCLELTSAAAINNVPFPTAQRWKAEAKRNGDDWDKARAAQLLAGGAVDDVVRQTLTLMVRNVQITMQQIEGNLNMPPDEKIKLLATASDAFSKNTSALRRLAPETDTLAVQLETVKKLAAFVRDQYPQHVAAFGEILRPFGERLANE